MGDMDTYVAYLCFNSFAHVNVLSYLVNSACADVYCYPYLLRLITCYL